MKLATYQKKVGKNIRAARVKLGLRQVDVEQLAGITYRHYQQLEYGNVNVGGR